MTETKSESKSLTRVEKIREVFQNPHNIERFSAYFQNDETKVKKFLQTLQMVALDDKLKDADPQSIFKCGITCAEIGLDPQPNRGLVYFVTYKGKLQLQIGYKGFITLLERAGKAIKTHAVYDCDEFSISISGFDEEVIFKPNLKERKEADQQWVETHLKGILVLIKDLSTGVMSVKFVQMDKLQQLKAFSPSAKSSFSPWKEWLIEMYFAKSIRYCISKTSMDEKTALAVEVENKLELLNKGLLNQKSAPSAIESDIAKETGANIIEVSSDEIESQENPDADFVESTGPNPFIDEVEK